MWTPSLALCVLAVAAGNAPATWLERDIYGEDDRYETYEISDKRILGWARSVAAMVPRKLISRDGKLRRGIRTLSLSKRNVSKTTKPRYLPVAPNVRFGSQPLHGVGTGFLVGPNLIVTAGHCVKQAKDLTKYYWVFDYAIDPATQSITINVGPDNVFEAREVLTTTGTTKADPAKNDYALVRLARSATRSRDGKPNGRKPLRIRRSGKINDDARLIMIGHPKGLPQKITIAGRIRSNDRKTHFQSTLDAFGGNSGSPVIHAKTGVVEGILVRSAARNWKEIVIGERSYATPIHFDEENGGTGTAVERITNIRELREGLSEGNQLFDAIAAEDLEAVQRLLERAPNLKRAKDSLGRNLIHALMASRSPKMLHVFQNKGISLTARDKAGRTPLHTAAEHRFLAGVRFLLKQEVAVNVTDRMGRTPYWLATKGGAKAVARLLERAGANPSIRPRNYQQLSEQLTAATRHGDAERVVELCGTPGVDVNLGPFTPLMWAVERGDERLVAFFLSLPRVDVHATTYGHKEGVGALYLARRKRHAGILKRLLAAGAKDTGVEKKWGKKLDAAISYIKRTRVTWHMGNNRLGRRGRFEPRGAGRFAIRAEHSFLNSRGLRRSETRTGSIRLTDIASAEQPQMSGTAWFVHLNLERPILHVDASNARNFMSSTCKIVLPSRKAATKWRSNLIKARSLLRMRERLCPSADNSANFGIVLSSEETAIFGDEVATGVRAGNAYALTKVGAAYMNGKGVRRDVTRGKLCLIRAYDLSDTGQKALTAFNLGVLHRSGNGLKPDRRKALEFFRESQKAGNHNARKFIDELSSPGK